MRVFPTALAQVNSKAPKAAVLVFKLVLKDNPKEVFKFLTSVNCKAAGVQLKVKLDFVIFLKSSTLKSTQWVEVLFGLLSKLKRTNPFGFNIQISPASNC